MEELLLRPDEDFLFLPVLLLPVLFLPVLLLPVLLLPDVLLSIDVELLLLDVPLARDCPVRFPVLLY